MILKAGTYRFNDVLNVVDGLVFDELVWLPIEPLTFEAEGKTATISSVGIPVIYNNGKASLFAQGVIGEISIPSITPYIDGEWRLPDIQTHTITEDVEADDIIGTWYIASTNYNEVNAKPLAEITYNGETIAQLNAGETATLSCKDKKMVSDVVVKVNEVESKIPDGYVKPEGTLELVFNNIEAEFPIDCSQYAKVTVNTAEPLKITDPTVLDNITDSPWAVGGNVFLYEGETTDPYENGTLYYLEDTEK